MGTLEKRHALTSLAAGAIAPAMALYPLLRPLIFSLDAERAHHLTLASLKALPNGRPLATAPMLSIKVPGLQFPNPVGLSAGFDKNAEVFSQILRLRFGFAEVAPLTPLPPAGQSQPPLSPQGPRLGQPHAR